MSAAFLIDRIDAALPQTQCTRCGYADCRAYAQAIAAGDAAINQCPPGGAEGIARLAAITGRDVIALNPANGSEGPRRVMFIDEARCIGCTLCIKACPVDCIVGAPKLMHTIIEDLCTGCELCLPACPVDCILVENASPEPNPKTGWAAWSEPDAERARLRYHAHRERSAAPLADPAVIERKRVAIQAAMARARAQRGAR